MGKFINYEVKFIILYDPIMKTGDAIRLYETDNFFHGGKIIEIDGDKIYVDWGEWIAQYVSNDFEHEFRDGSWSWRPLNEGNVVVIKDEC